MKRQDFKNLVTEMENRLAETMRLGMHQGLCNVTSRVFADRARGNAMFIRHEIYDKKYHITDSIKHFFKDREALYWLGTTNMDKCLYHRAMVIYLWEQIILDNGDYKKW